MPVNPARLLAVGVLLLTLSACARYTALPLDASAHYATRVDTLVSTHARQAPFDEAAITQLILENSPALKLAALRRAEARGQAASAALPPNPSLSGSLGYLLSGAGDGTAWTAALSQPVNGWITLRARREEARASVAEVDATLAWEAWQAIARGRQLVADISFNERLAATQQQMAALLRAHEEVLAKAEARGDIEASATAPVAQAASEAAQAFAETERTLATQRRDLHALVGLSYDAALPLAPLPPLAPLDANAVSTAIDALPQHRPDLLALSMGYAAEDARFRVAILSQFPPLSVGYDASQDNSRVTNGGPSLTLDLPLFDRGSAQVDAARASRQRLHDEYSQRIADARDEAQALDAACRAGEATLAAARAIDADARRPSRPPAEALSRGDLDRGTYTDLTAASLARRMAALRTELAVREQRIALETLLGMGMPALSPDKDFR
jgi:outer membrane protein TolC